MTAGRAVPAVLAVVEVTGLPGIGEVGPGNDLAAVLADAVARAGLELRDDDVLAVSSKVVSKAEGRAVRAEGRDGAIDAETVRVVAERLTPRGRARIVESRSGPVLAAAGVDASNVAPGTVLLLPADPDASARGLRAALGARTGRRPAVVVTDTLGRPWRDGQVDAAIGAAGLRVADDLRGGVDAYGNALEVTVRALADEVAAAADLVKGKLDGVPAALLRGLGAHVTAEDGPGAAALLRDGAADWFRLGHVEAVRTALAVPPGTSGVAPAPVPAGTVLERLRRAVDVALASPAWPVPASAGLEVAVTARGADEARARLGLLPAAGAGEVLALGALTQRVLALAWTEGLRARVTGYEEGSADAGPRVELAGHAQAAPEADVTLIRP